MSGIAGLAHFQKNYIAYQSYNKLLVRDMADSLAPDSDTAHGEWVGEHAAFAWCGDSKEMPQPISATVEGYTFSLVADGMLFRPSTLRSTLQKFGYRLETGTDSELMLYAYIHYGPDCVRQLDGTYAFCIWDSMRQQIFACRDRSGARPLYYAYQNGGLLFASAPQALFRHPAVHPKLQPENLRTVLCGAPGDVFSGITELMPAHTLTYRRSGLKTQSYWTPPAENPEISAGDLSEQFVNLLQDNTTVFCRYATASFFSCHPAGALLAELCKKESAEPLENLAVSPTDSAEEICRLLTKIPALTGLPDAGLADGAALYLFRSLAKRHTGILSDVGAGILDGTPPKSSALISLLLPAVRETLLTEQPATNPAYTPTADLVRLARLCGNVRLFLPFCRREILELVLQLPPEQRPALLQTAHIAPPVCPVGTAADFVPILQRSLRHLLENRDASVLAFLDKTLLTLLAETPPHEMEHCTEQLTAVLQLESWLSFIVRN